MQSTRQAAESPLAHATDQSPRWTRRAHIDIDGLLYEVCVAVRRGEYVGVWICRHCGEHGATAGTHTTADQASARAQIDLCAHHNLVHRRPRKPK